ncbi:hypothetical protein [Streptomyces sp. SudanB52_2052]|uniref:hypothetical protein n=1 Tax=Streptomyces sp. SudanB52_2052 TaxID=3035276 RepID=UPI003F54B1D2
MAGSGRRLFHVRGVGGVGKSTLLRQWQETARRAGAVTAVVDEGDVHGVQQALTDLARQLAGQAGPLKEYDRAAEQYRREQETAAESVPAEGEASVSSRVVAQAALGAVSLIPGAGPVAAMAGPDAAAQGLDRLRSGARVRGRRARASDAVEVSRAFVSELYRLCGRYPWVVLFLDTWEVTGRYLDGWLRDLLEDAFGPLPAHVMVVLAGRDELAEREWAPLRALAADVPLDVFTAAETRDLLATRGVTEPDAVERHAVTGGRNSSPARRSPATRTPPGSSACSGRSSSTRRTGPRRPPRRSSTAARTATP